MDEANRGNKINKVKSQVSHYLHTTFAKKPIIHAIELPIINNQLLTYRVKDSIPFQKKSKESNSKSVDLSETPFQVPNIRSNIIHDSTKAVVILFSQITK